MRLWTGFFSLETRRLISAIIIIIIIYKRYDLVTAPNSLSGEYTSVQIPFSLRETSLQYRTDSWRNVIQINAVRCIHSSWEMVLHHRITSRQTRLTLQSWREKLPSSDSSPFPGSPGSQHSGDWIWRTGESQARSVSGESQEGLQSQENERLTYTTPSTIVV